MFALRVPCNTDLLLAADVEGESENREIPMGAEIHDVNSEALPTIDFDEGIVTSAILDC